MIERWRKLPKELFQLIWEWRLKHWVADVGRVVVLMMSCVDCLDEMYGDASYLAKIRREALKIRHVYETLKWSYRLLNKYEIPEYGITFKQALAALYRHDPENFGSGMFTFQMMAERARSVREIYGPQLGIDMLD